MVKQNFYNIVEALLPDQPSLSLLQRKQIVYDCADFVKRQIAIAPLLVNVALHILCSIMVFSFYICSPRQGTHIPLKQRRARLTAIIKVLPPLYLGVKAMRSLILLRFMENQAVKEALSPEKNI